MAAEEEVDLDMDEGKEEDLDIDKVEVEEAVDAYMVAVAVVVEALDEESTTIVSTKIEGRITIMKLKHRIL